MEKYQDHQFVFCCVCVKRGESIRSRDNIIEFCQEKVSKLGRSKYFQKNISQMKLKNKSLVLNEKNQMPRIILTTTKNLNSFDLNVHLNEIWRSTSRVQIREKILNLMLRKLNLK
jgi:hypothetical protein